MISPSGLPAARKAFRQCVVMPETEIADVVLMASALCNFDPERTLPIWLVVVGPPASGKTDLIKVLMNWRYVHVLPNPLTPAYFLSAMNRNKSALYKMAAGSKRLMMMQDMLQFTRMRYDKELGRVYAQLIDIHDGRFKRETGWESLTLEYDASKTGLLGWIGSGTEAFYDFQEKANEWGSRFMIYNFRSKQGPWESTDHLRRVADLNAIVTAADRQVAHDHILGFLDDCVAHIAHFYRIDLPEYLGAQVRAAVTLAQRAIATGKDNDPGTRLYKRLSHMARMVAFMSARAECDQSDATMACRIAVSQIPVERREILDFAMLNRDEAEGWTMAQLCEHVGGIRQVYTGPLQRLVDVGIVETIGRRRADGAQTRAATAATQFKLTAKACDLIAQFDIDETIFHVEKR